jgi:hypothetical protein
METINGRGWLDYKQGPRVYFNDLKSGHLYLTYSPQFESFNTVQVLDIDPPVNGKRLGRPLAYCAWHDEEGTFPGSKFAVWEGESMEFYKPEFKAEGV